MTTTIKAIKLAPMNAPEPVSFSILPISFIVVVAKKMEGLVGIFPHEPPYLDLGN
jgi:hypothetical protein